MFAYGPADVTAIPKPPSSFASFESRLVLLLWYWLTQVVLEKRPLNGRSSNSSMQTNKFFNLAVNAVMKVPLVIVHNTHVL